MPVTFGYVQPTQAQKDLMAEFRVRFGVLYDDIKKLPANRGLALALTKLEESSMWLNKSITENC
jgi:hypothetical protein